MGAVIQRRLHRLSGANLPYARGQNRASRIQDHRASAGGGGLAQEARGELAKPGALLGAKPAAAGATLADAIDRYIADNARAMGRTKTQVLRPIKTYDIADKFCADIASHDYVEFAKAVKASGRKPQTIENYMSHLGPVVSIARSAWGFALDRQALADGRIAARALGLTSKGDKRSRRPTLEELGKNPHPFRRPEKAQADNDANDFDHRLRPLLDLAPGGDHPHRLGRSR
jgi:hypothetical protein